MSLLTLRVGDSTLPLVLTHPAIHLFDDLHQLLGLTLPTSSMSPIMKVEPFRLPGDNGEACNAVKVDSRQSGESCGAKSFRGKLNPNGVSQQSLGSP